MASKDITKLDLYALLEVAETATKKEIVTAYRKKALKCHPDKNPDNPNAALEFQQLSSALEVLTDVSAKAAYDKIWRAKKAAKARNRDLDSKRKKLKEDLEARENAYESQKAKEDASHKDFEAEIDRLRKEGSQLLAQEQELLKEQMKRELKESQIVHSPPEVLPRLKMKWRSRKGDESNGGYSTEVFEQIFSKYGEVTGVVVSSKKNGTGIVEFKTLTMAQKALLSEHGFEDNPVTLSWIESPSPYVASRWDSEEVDEDRAHKVPPKFTFQPKSYQPMMSHERDYESLVLRKLRQAEERKKLTEEMMKDDKEI